jgi:hypothetical protein
MHHVAQVHINPDGFNDTVTTFPLPPTSASSSDEYGEVSRQGTRQHKPWRLSYNGRVVEVDCDGHDWQNGETPRGLPVRRSPLLLCTDAPKLARDVSNKLKDPSAVVHQCRVGHPPFLENRSRLKLTHCVHTVFPCGVPRPEIRHARRRPE